MSADRGCPDGRSLHRVRDTLLAFEFLLSPDRVLKAATESRELDAGFRVVGRLHVTLKRLPPPPVEGEALPHSSVAPLTPRWRGEALLIPASPPSPPGGGGRRCFIPASPRCNRRLCQPRSSACGGSESGVDAARAAHSPCRGPCAARTRRWRRGVGEPVQGGSTRPVAEQCGTTVRHCVIPSSESISAQRGADVRVVKDPQGGLQATRSTDRGWSLSRSAGSAGSAGSGRRLRGALGNSPRALDHVAHQLRHQRLRLRLRLPN